MDQVCQDHLDLRGHKDKRVRRGHQDLPDPREWMAQRARRDHLVPMGMKEDRDYLEIRDHGDHPA